MPGHWGGSTSRSTSRSSSGSHSRSYNPGAGGVVSHAPARTVTAPTRTYERSHHPTQGVVTHAPITPTPVAPLTGHPVPTEQEISQANLKAFVRDQEEKRLAERGNQYDPTFRQRIRMGMDRLGQGVSRGIGSLAMMMNPFAAGVGLAGNRQAGMLMNLLTRGKRQRGNQYFDPDEARDIERELSMMAPYSTNYLKNLDLSKYDTPTDLQDIDFGIGNFDLGTFGFDKERTIEQDQDLATQRFVKLNRAEQTELTVLKSKKENADALGMPWTDKDQKDLQDLLDKEKEGSLMIDDAATQIAEVPLEGQYFLPGMHPFAGDEKPLTQEQIDNYYANERSLMAEAEQLTFPGSMNWDNPNQIGYPWSTIGEGASPYSGSLYEPPTAAEGGLIRKKYSKGGIVGLWRELSSL